jgi:uncharacterized protein
MQIIDRRLNSKNKSTVNRQRFIRRFKSQIKKSVEKAITKRGITDIERGESISIPKKDIMEPTFKHGQSGENKIILPGNKTFQKGDHLNRPKSDSGDGGSGASNQGEGSDEFVFSLTKEEFIDLFFEDLELPDLVKTHLKHTTEYQYVKGGFSTVGIPPNINIIRSLRNAIGRRIAFSRDKRKTLKELENELEQALKNSNTHPKKIIELTEKMKQLKNKIESVPFIDEYDIRYNTHIKTPAPSTNAVMFCIMDVSGSMDETKKEMAKRFFILLYLFLTRTYQKLDLVFIRHHTTAKEVDEQEFFYSRETGGTVVSSALELMKQIMRERYPTDEWNIYAAQASDGDNWNSDSPLCQQLLLNDIMPYLQYFAYVEILPRHHQSLWHAYLGINEIFHNFTMRSIHEINQIYPVFHQLFKRKAA